MLVLFLFLFAAAHSHRYNPFVDDDNPIQNVNEIVDRFLSIAREIVINAGLDWVPIADYNFGVLLNCRRGMIGRLSTIKRVGRAIMVTGYRKFTLSVKIGFDDLKFSFDPCTTQNQVVYPYSTYIDPSWLVILSFVRIPFSALQLLDPPITSYIEGMALSNSFDLDIILEEVEGEMCLVSIDILRIRHLGPIHITSGGLLRFVSNYILPRYHTEIVQKLNQLLKRFAKETMGNINLCNISQ